MNNLAKNLLYIFIVIVVINLWFVIAVAFGPRHVKPRMGVYCRNKYISIPTFFA